jgi:hypothetical protein
MKTVAKLHNPELCGVKARYAEDLTREETATLMNWCDWQNESLWDGMNLQEILNVYRVSSIWEDFQSWTEEEGDKARRAWNRVVRPQNHLILLGD